MHIIMLFINLLINFEITMLIVRYEGSHKMRGCTQCNIPYSLVSVGNNNDPYLGSHLWAHLRSSNEHKSAFPQWESFVNLLELLKGAHKLFPLSITIFIEQCFFYASIDMVNLNVGPLNWGTYRYVIWLCQKSHGHDNGFDHFCVQIMNRVTWSSRMMAWSL
jgi:hypothetical protein